MHFEFICANRFKVSIVNVIYRNYVPGFWPDGNIKISPTEQVPSLYAKGMEILDNWAYKTMRVGIFAAGLGLKIKSNIPPDKSGKINWVSSSGRFTVLYIATNVNREIDFSGWNVEVVNNQITVF